jgi:hypothetical protein
LDADAAPGFVAANIGQALWCAAFRPWLGPQRLWLPASLLATTALCLVAATVRASPTEKLVQRLSVVLSTSSADAKHRGLFEKTPRSIHLGWCCAAALVNANAAVAASGATAAICLACAQASVGAALACGLLLSASGLPAAGLAVAWALEGLHAAGLPKNALATAVGAAPLEALVNFEHTAAIAVAMGAVAVFLKRATRNEV